MNISQHQHSIDNYQDPRMWATHPEAAERIAYHQAQIDRLREKNRQQVARARARKAELRAGRNPGQDRKTLDRVQRLRDRIAQKQDALRYYGQNRTSNPEYYDRQIALAQLDIEMAMGSLEALTSGDGPGA